MPDPKQKSIVGCSDLSHLYTYKIHLLPHVFIKTIKSVHRTSLRNLRPAFPDEKDEPMPLNSNNLITQASAREILAYGVSKNCISQHVRSLSCQNRSRNCLPDKRRTRNCKVEHERAENSNLRKFQQDGVCVLDARPWLGRVMGAFLYSDSTGIFLKDVMSVAAVFCERV